MSKVQHFLNRKISRSEARRLWKAAAWILVAGIAALAVLFIYLVEGLPSPGEIAAHTVTESTKIYDRTGTVLLYEISGGKRRTTVSFSEIPQSLKDATISIEDKNFYSEPAFNIRGIARAVFSNLTGGDLTGQGGSTITQQLARNAFLSPEKTFTRKLRELILAIQLDRQYTKDKILEMYLNEIPYGPMIYGVESASETYFGKPVGELTLAQSAVVAALPQAPSRLSPWGSHVDQLMERQRLVLRQMYDLGKVSRADYDAAVAERIVFTPQSPYGINAPHFVLTVQDYLLNKYGEDAVRNGGLRVKTTLDWDLEQAAEKAVADGAKRNQDLYGGSNAALVAEDPTTGQILAMVGSRNYFDKEIQGSFNVAVQGLRQPGSSLKPFVYLDAFIKGYTPNTVLFDVPTEFAANNPKCPAVPDFTSANGGDSHCFHPQDFEGYFQGPLPIRAALAQSVNIPAVKMLYLVGQPGAVKLMQSFGLSTLTNPDQYGLSLVLGGGAVHLIDLVKAYSVLSQEGILHNQSMILEVRDKDDRVLESYADNNTRVMDNPQPIREINDILSDPDARAPLFQASQNQTVFPGYDVAMKTGTSNDYRDAWTVGYTPSLVVGVWAGNNDNTPMHRQGSSILAAVPIWHNFMVEALKKQQPQTFAKPDPTTPAKPVLGGDYAPGGVAHTILFYVNPENPTGPDPVNPGNDPQFANWETGVVNWAVLHPLQPTSGSLVSPAATTNAPVLSP